MGFVPAVLFNQSRRNTRSSTVCAVQKGFGKPPTCECGSKLPYDKCCGPIHKLERKADNAVDLMRARYTAYKLSLADFIMDTTIGAKEKEDAESWKSALKTYMKITKFKGLKVLKTEKGTPGDEIGFVTFEVKANKNTYQEKSKFLPNDKYGWAYVQAPDEEST